MPGYKRTYRRRYKKYNRRRRARRKPITQIVRNVINKEAETKYSQTIQAGSGLGASYASFTLFSTMSQGLDDTDFTGRGISLIGLTLNLEITNMNTTNNAAIRVMVVEWRDKNTIFDLSQVLQSITSTYGAISPYTLDHEGLYKVHYDRRYELAANVTENYNRSKLFKIRKYFRKPIDCRWSGTSVVFDPDFRLVIVSNQSSSFPYLTFYNRITYKDM